VLHTILYYGTPMNIVTQQSRIANNYKQYFGARYGNVKPTWTGDETKTVLQIGSNLVTGRSYC